MGWGVGVANVAMPLGNLDPYFALSVSTTFFDIETKALLCLISDLKKNNKKHMEELLETIYWREKESYWV